MTFAEFGRNAASELKSFYYIMLAHRYLKKAHKHVHKDKVLSLAYINVANAYKKRSQAEGHRNDRNT